MSFKPFHVVVYLAFLILIVYVFAPYIWLFTASLSIGANLSVKIPGHPTFANFAHVFTGRTLRWVVNSLLISVLATVGSIVVATPGGYALSRGTFRGRPTLMYAIILMRVIPATLIIVPLYGMFLVTHLLNTYFGLILVYIAVSVPLNLWITKGAADAIPRELEEAAEIDGASRLRILSSIVFPLMRPGVGAAAVMSFMGAWSDFLLPLIVFSDDKKYPIAVGLFTAFGINGEVNYSQLATLCLIYIIPIVVIYFSVGRAFSRGFGSIGVAEK